MDDEQIQRDADGKPLSAFDRDEPPHVGAEEDRSRPSDGDLTTEDLGEGGPAGG